MVEGFLTCHRMPVDSRLSSPGLLSECCYSSLPSYLSLSCSLPTHYLSLASSSFHLASAGPVQPRVALLLLSFSSAWIRVLEVSNRMESHWSGSVVVLEGRLAGSTASVGCETCVGRQCVLTTGVRICTVLLLGYHVYHS
jgi:hypothetical protein